MMATDTPDTEKAADGAAPAPSVLILLHYPEGQWGFPNIYVSAPGALILSVDDNTPGDRVFQMQNNPIPADLLESIKGLPVGHIGDDAGKDAKAARARRSGLAGGFGQAERPGLFLGRATARPSGDRRSPGSTRKCCAACGAVSSPWRAAGRTTPLSAGFSSCPVPPPALAGRQSSKRAARFALLPCRTAPIFKEGTARPPPQNGGHKWQWTPMFFAPATAAALTTWDRPTAAFARIAKP